MHLDIPKETCWIKKPINTTEQPSFDQFVYGDEHYEWTDDKFLEMFVDGENVNDNDIKRVFTVKGSEFIKQPTPDTFHRDIYVMAADGAEMEAVHPDYVVQVLGLIKQYDKFKKYYIKSKSKLKQAMKRCDLYDVRKFINDKGFLMLLNEITQPTGEKKKVKSSIEAGTSFAVKGFTELKITGNEVTLLCIDRDIHDDKESN